ncbi:5-formyltetrahydrofolate cyclo-ligase [Pandoraea norimbergensis]|uniref:5-formyltetrahydrofolate cyclo-ligase n=1 Tax=Pandoraea norimbergensis TaxID=93219 RepID=UPI0007E4DFCD|nr:5-formyltetrahydrofolate cyclo-ligase [Pandoraea norimbergensis]AOX47923.1 5-formyltetrahydrofolate cyclo-ligase [Pandoraea norimbergensis]
MDSSIARDIAQTAADAHQKRELRRSLLATREALAGRDTLDAALARRLTAEIARRAPRCIGFYWPIQSEFDARGVVGAWLGELASAPDSADAADSAAASLPRLAALPVVTAPATPLVFHRWTPDTPMIEGRYRIPVPQDTEVLVPDLLLVPCVGFTRDGLRLGYGGGFYDRTLHALSPRPQTLGIAYDALEIASLVAEAHDLALDAIVTETATYNATGARATSDTSDRPHGTTR